MSIWCALWAGVVLTEAAVEAIGRITPQGAGIWKDKHILMAVRQQSQHSRQPMPHRVRGLLSPLLLVSTRQQCLAKFQCG